MGPADDATLQPATDSRSNWIQHSDKGLRNSVQTLEAVDLSVEPWSGLLDKVIELGTRHIVELHIECVAFADGLQGRGCHLVRTRSPSGDVSVEVEGRSPTKDALEYCHAFIEGLGEADCKETS
jgi:hypothetical protein